MLANFGADGTFDPLGAQAGAVALIKAMTQGDGITTANAAVPGSASPLAIQDLQGTLAVATTTAADAVFFGMLQPETYIARAPSIQYDVLTNYGEAQIFNKEISRPSESDDTYVRRIAKTAPLGLTARISFRANATSLIGNIDMKSRTSINKMAEMLRGVEVCLFTGNSDIIPEQFDGIEKLIADQAPANLLDLRGAAINYSFMNKVVAFLYGAPNYGSPTHAIVPTQVYGALLDEIIPVTGNGGTLRLPNGQPDVAYGSNIASYRTQFGVIKLVPDRLIQPGQPAPDLGFGPSASRPVAPLSGGAITTPVNAAGLFAAGDAGDYIYKICAINYRGFSAPLVTGAVTVAAGDSVNIPIVAGDTITTGYVVYRSTKGGAASTCREAFRIAKTGPTQTIIDLNAYLPGTAKAYVLSMNSRAQDGAPDIQWAQLSPMTSVDLAVVDTSIQWMIYTDAALLLRVPKRHAVIYNIAVNDSGLNVAATGIYVV